MSDKKLNAIKEIEFRVEACKKICSIPLIDWDELNNALNEIDTLLFDINDFINDLKDE